MKISASAGIVKKRNATTVVRSDSDRRRSKTPASISVMATAMMKTPAGRPATDGGFANNGSMNPGAASVTMISTHRGRSPRSTRGPDRDAGRTGTTDERCSGGDRLGHCDAPS